MISTRCSARCNEVEQGTRLGRTCCHRPPFELAFRHFASIEDGHVTVQVIGQNDLFNADQPRDRPFDPLMEDPVLPMQIPCNSQVFVSCPRLSQDMLVASIDRGQIGKAAIDEILNDKTFPWRSLLLGCATDITPTPTPTLSWEDRISCPDPDPFQALQFKGGQRLFYRKKTI